MIIRRQNLAFFVINTPNIVFNGDFATVIEFNDRIALLLNCLGAICYCIFGGIYISFLMRICAVFVRFIISSEQVQSLCWAFWASSCFSRASIPAWSPA